MIENIPEPEVLEIAHRRNDGIDVFLYWIKDTISTYVEVVDHKLGGASLRAYTPDGVSPNDVFQHPFAYSPQRVDG